MKIRRITIAGFGRLHDRAFTFGDHLNVVYGPNEAGKSTLAAAIVASLYGPGRRREFWRPWSGGSYATTLIYDLGDGRRFEVQRDFDRDAKGTRVYDRDGNDVTAAVAVGKNAVPGEFHLQIPHDTFVNASCALQQSVEIDAARNATIATSLARALDGGPKDDAALGALKRLEEARKSAVGTPKATVNNPLQRARESLAAFERDARNARNSRDALAGVRERRAAAVAERERLIESRTDAEREAKALRAAELRARIDELREYRDDLAALQTERARYDDVATFPADRCTELDAAFYDWQTADATANAAATAATEAALSSSEAAEIAAREADAGKLDELELAALRVAAEQAETARATATAAANEAAAARREGNGGRSIAGAVLVIAALLAAITIAFAIAHWWSFTEIFALLTAVAFAAIGWRSRDRVERMRVAAHKQKIADESLAVERSASAAVGAVLERLSVPSVEELTRRFERLGALREKRERALAAAKRAAELRTAEADAARRFDALAHELVPDVTGSRRGRRDAADGRGMRRRERDGIDNGIAMLAVRRSEILRGDDEFALVAERDALAAEGIVPAGAVPRGQAERHERRIVELTRLTQEADLTIARLTTELELGEGNALDLAALEEEVERARAEVLRLEALDRALKLAIATVETTTHEAHQAFARRLETYAAGDLRAVTAGRYGELFVDPVSFAIRVRVPETDAIVDLDSLSAGTRDQIYLIVRFAMARMFAEGLELAPLLLDDPFAYWDAARIERCLPLIAQSAFGAQTILFTSSAELADAAEAIGANRIDIAAMAAAPPPVVSWN